MARQQQEVLHSAARITGIDLDWDGLCRHPGIRDRVFGNLEKLPFAAGSFDVVSANMVVEHLERPEQTAAEIHRVLSPGGLFVFHTPNLYHWAILPARLTPDGMKKRIVRFLEGRSEEDVFRTHYRMNSAKDVRRIASVSGFEVSELKQVSGSATLAALGWAAFPELIYIRMLRANKLGTFRSNLVGVLRKR
jgi:SAM-dependent methyltransferase